MTVDAWLQMAINDAERRGVPELRPLLEMLARGTQVLRDAATPAPDDNHPPSRR